MNERELIAAKEAIRRHTEAMIALPVEELRAKLERSERETEEGWLGISDWLLSMGAKTDGN